MNDDTSTTIQISRERAAALGHETVAILEAGSYGTATGVRVDIGAAVARAAEATVTYRPADQLPQQSTPAITPGGDDDD
jgi:hypothetical protein